MWIENLHPRDEYGRFKLSGGNSYWDKLKGGQANRVHAANIAELEASWSRQFYHFQPLKKAGKLTPEQDREWDRDIERRDALQAMLPDAHHRRMVPHQDGTWRYPRTSEYRAKWDAVFDPEGRPVPHMALQGATRVGDHPDDEGGVWHKPGEYDAGRSPVLRNQFGHRMSRFLPEPKRSQEDRRKRGAFSRAESRAEAAQAHWHLGRNEEASRGASPEIHGAHMLSPLNPSGRPRVARKQHRRKTSPETWIKRLNTRMEGR